MNRQDAGIAWQGTGWGDQMQGLIAGVLPGGCATCMNVLCVCVVAGALGVWCQAAKHDGDPEQCLSQPSA